MSLIIQRVRRCLWLGGSDPGWLELWSGFVAIYWGVVLLLPFDTFAGQISTGFYRVMADAMSEDRWGALALCVGIVQVCSLGMKRGGIAWIADSLATGFWGVIAFTIWTAAPYTASPGIHGGLAVSMAYSTWFRVRHGYGD